MRAYSLDLRERVPAACDGGMTTSEAAKEFSVSPAWVRRLKQRRQGDEVPAPVAPRRPPPTWAAHADRIRKQVRATPDATLVELKSRLGLDVSIATLCRAMRALRLTLKKILRAPEQDRPDMRRRRDEWLRGVPGLDADKLVFIDETWVATNMTRRRGRCPRDERLVCRVPHGHWKTTTFVAALRTSGVVAPMVIDGALTGDLFVAYIRQCLATELRPGDIVVLDKLQCHKRAEAVRAVEAAGATIVYLPPYSPDLNPIENAFSKLKGVVRSAGERTVEGLWSLLGRSLDAFAPDECRNYFRHYSYAATLR